MWSTNSFLWSLDLKRLRPSIDCQYYNVYTNADDLLEIFFARKEQEHMGYIVLITDVGCFFKTMRKILFRFS